MLKLTNRINTTIEQKELKKLKKKKLEQKVAKP